MGNIKERIKNYFGKYQAAKQAKIRQEFLPEALEIIGKPPAPMGHFVILLTAGIVLFFVVWSIVGKMDEVVTARGKVITVSGVQTIQAFNTGIVEQICVEEGDHVSAGQDIIVVDSSVNSIALQNTEESLVLLKLENENVIEEQKPNHEIQTITAQQQRVVSPVDGIIKTLEVNTVGGVLTTAQPVATIVPDGEQMIVEHFDGSLKVR